MRVIDLPDPTDEELEALLERAAANHIPLQSMATSECNVGTGVGGTPVTRAAGDWINPALRRWATNPYTENVRLGEPLLWWAGSRDQVVAVTMLAAQDGLPSDDPWARPWVLATHHHRRSDNGVWEPQTGASAAGAFHRPEHDDHRRELAPSQRVPLEWVARAVDESNPDNPGQRVQRYARTMYRLLIEDITEEDGAFGQAWVAWHEDIRGRRVRTDSEYVALAVRYFALTQVSPRPLVDIAQQVGKSEIAIRKAILRARARNLVRPSTSGRAGGSLTEDGLLVLARMLADDLF